MRRAALITALLLTSTACATRAPIQPLPPDDPRPRLLLDGWIESAEERRGLRGRARLAVDRDEEGLHLRSKQLVLLEKPSSMRVEVLGLLNQSHAVLVTDGARFEVYRAEDQSHESGPVDDQLLWKEAGISLSPREAVAVLLGAPDFAPGLSATAAVRDGEGRIRIDLSDAAGVLRERAVFDPSGSLRGFERLDHRGNPIWKAQFDEYRDVGGLSFAHAIVLDVAAGATHAEISFRNVELNPELSPDLFRLQLPGAADREPGGGHLD